MEQSAITKKWQTLSKRVMLIGIIVGIIICIAMFTFLGVFMNAKSISTMNEVGEMYMEGMGTQSVLRYNSVIEQRTTMIEGLCKTYPADEENVNEKLKVAAQARDFAYLALMDADGNLEMIYGDQVVADDPEPFKTSIITKKEIKVAVATSYKADGTTVINNGVILIGVPAHEKGYPLSDGTESSALVAGLSNEEIVKMLSEKNTDGSTAQRFNTHIIRRGNGTYVMHTNETPGNETPYLNYFEEIRATFDMDAGEINSLIDTMKTKMAKGEVYSTVITTSSSRKHMYCAQLSHSEWYLVTIMEYADLDSIVGKLSNTWTGFTIGACAVILVIMLVIFTIYFLLNRQNLKQLEEAKQTAEEASKAKSEFLSNMSHDIRTPMNAIVGMTAIATANIDNKQQVSDCLKKISLSSRHLLGLINDVLDMSKIESGKMTLNMEQLSLSEVVEGIATIVQPQIKIKRQKFDIFVSNIVAESVYCDSVRLNQVLLNLLSNAYKFTPEEGNITLSLHQEASPLGDRYIRTHIEVQDNGIGMSEEFKAKIFDSFTREDRSRVNKTEGTGLGMSITKYIVDAMHGTIEVDSTQGKGTKFHIILDLEIAETAEIDMILPQWKMLVVDDDQMLCDTTVSSLASIGVTAEATLDGETAIEMAVKAHESGNDYNIILMDWKLPGIDGIETARRLHASLDKDIPILLISAYDWSEIEDEARSAGISGFISKPLFKSTLFYGLRQFTETVPGEDKKPEAAKKEVSLEGKHILIA
ncbi:MAG: response regulator, partial [Clostridia bacterium]|nr:response regulator [Clostridia bacterium]